MGNRSIDRNRDNTIDIARGIGIICVLMGHLKWKGSLYHLVYPFHMPLFFLISGWFLLPERTPLSYFKHKSRQLLVPYAFTVLLDTILAVLLSPGTSTTGEIILNNAASAVYASGSIKNLNLWGIQKIGAVWFIPASVISCSIVYLIVYAIKSQRVQILTICTLFIVSVWSARIIWLPFSIQAAGSAAVFVYIGWFFHRRLPKKAEDYFIKHQNAIPVLGVLALLYEFILGLYVEVSQAQYPYPYITVTFAIVISCSVIWFSSKMVGSIAERFLCFYGRYSLLVLCTHQLLQRYFPWERVYAMTDMICTSEYIRYAVNMCIQLGCSALWIYIVLHNKNLRRLYSIK